MRISILTALFLFNIIIFCQALPIDNEPAMTKAELVTAIADAGPDQVLSCVVNVVILGGANTSMGPEFTYEWSDINGNIFDSNPTVEMDTPGEYILAVTNTSTSFLDVDTVNVTADYESPEFEIEYTDNVLTCANPSVQLTSVLDDSSIDAIYKWYDPNGTVISTDENLEVSTSGSYTLSVTSLSSGCSSVGTENVLEDIQSTITNIDYGTFSTFPIEIDAGSYTSNMSASYSWEARDGLQVDSFPVAIISKAGDFTLLEDLGNSICVNKYIFKVLGNVLTADAGPDQSLTCAEPVVTLMGSTSSTGASFTYEWIGADGFFTTAQNPQVNEPGMYILTVTDPSTGESASDTMEVFIDIEIPNDVFIAGGETLTCENNVIQLFGSTSTPNVSYLWSTSDGNIATDPTLTSINISQAGEYTLSVTDNNNGCSSQSIEIVESNQTEESTIIVPTINSTQPDVMLHAVDYVDEENEGPHEFVWSDQNGPFDDLPSIMVEESGIYTVTATNIYGCVTTIIFTVNFGQNLVADAGPTQKLNCVTDVVNIGSTNTSTGPNITYTWTVSSGAFFSDAYQPQVSVPDQYRLTVTDTNTGETAVDAVFINEDFDEPDFVLVSTTNVLTCENPTVLLSAVLDNPFLGVTYEWNGPGITGSIEDQVVASAGGDYALQVTNINNGCIVEQQTIIVENFESTTTNIDFGTFSNFPTEIDPSSFITNPSATYSWEAKDGLQVNNFPVAIISKPGDYTLLEGLGSASCVNRYVFKVLGGGTIADAGPDQMIDCIATSVVLGSNTTSVGSEYTYTWADESNNQIGTTPFIEVTNPGLYTLTVFNTQDNTFDSDDVIVSFDDVIPIINIPTPDILDCENTIVTVQGFTSGGTNLEFQWSTFDGSIISANNLANIDVDEPGEYTLEVTDPSTGCNAFSIAIVTQNIDGGNFDIEPIQSSVYPIAITADDFPAGLNLNFAWIPTTGLTVTSTTSAEIAQPGQYTFVATNIETGCDYNYIYTVYNNVLADAGLSQSLTCTSNSVTIGGLNSTAGPNIEYNWLDQNGQSVATTPTLEVNESGLYTLLVTDAMTGESISDQVLVSEDFEIPFVDIVSPAPLTIENPIASIDATLNYGPDAAIVEFLWTTFDGNIISNPKNEDIEVDKAGIYVLTVTNTVNGCSATGSTAVVQNFDSDIILLETIVVSDFPVQLDPSAIIADTAGFTHQPYPLIRSSNFEFKWVERQGLQITDFPLAQAFQDGIYAFLKIELSTGFVTRYEYDIELSTGVTLADAGPDVTINCLTAQTAQLGGSSTSTGSGFEYEWKDANGKIIGRENSLVVSNAGVYSLTVLNTSTQESATDFVEVVVDLDEPTISIDAPDSLNCSNSEVTLDLSIAQPSISEVSILWDGPGIISDLTAEDITVNQAGIYTVTVANLNNGCETTSTVLVDEDTNVPVLSLNITNISCFGLEDGSIDAVVSGGTAPYSFDMLSQTELSAGEYTVSVTDADGCMAVATGVVSEPEPLSLEFNINNNNEIEAIVAGGVGGYSYDWNVEADSNIIDNPINGTAYELTITDANGCVITDTYVFVQSGVFTQSAKQIRVSPNPTDGLLYVHLDGHGSEEISQLEVFDIQGKSMNLNKRSISNSKITLDLSQFQAGAYILQADIGGDLYYQKVIVF